MQTLLLVRASAAVAASLPFSAFSCRWRLRSKPLGLRIAFRRYMGVLGFRIRESECDLRVPEEVSGLAGFRTSLSSRHETGGGSFDAIHSL